MEELPAKQPKDLPIQKYRFKKGVSGNPLGVPKGTVSMKVWARNHLAALPEDERLDFINSLPASLTWQMAEGNPDNKTQTEIKINTTFTKEQIDATRKLIGLEGDSSTGSGS
jgi:hypothetical protein